jgi:hypothetical protein
MLAGCAVWSPFDRDHYIGRADAELVVDGDALKVSWNVPIDRTSSFNPYSASGGQDKWTFALGRGSITLRDGTVLWIDASHSIAEADTTRLLGLTGTQPVTRPLRSPDMLGPGHPIKLMASVYVATANPPDLKIFSGACGKDRKATPCQATIRLSVPENYVAPYDRNPLNYWQRPG